jgi:hypothetical protein
MMTRLQAASGSIAILSIVALLLVDLMETRAWPISITPTTLSYISIVTFLLVSALFIIDRMYRARVRGFAATRRTQHDPIARQIMSLLHEREMSIQELSLSLDRSIDDVGFRILRLESRALIEHENALVPDGTRVVARFRPSKTAEEVNDRIAELA